MSIKKTKLVAVLGPTATGKSDLGVKLALRFNGEVVSADSRQVYRDLDIGANKITKKEKRGIRHHLIDVASPQRNFNVVKFQKKAERAIVDILKREKNPILVGGSPLYIYGIIDGWIFPPTSPNHKMRQVLSRQNNEELLKILQGLDPEYAKKVDAQNPRRLIRAIEIATELGSVPVIEKKPRFETLLIGLKAPKKEIEKKIIQRLNKRMALGLVKEASILHQRKISWKRLESFGLEYRWMALYLQGKINEIEMKQGIIKDSLKLVKHQMNWFKKDRRINWVAGFSEAAQLTARFLREN